MGRVRGDDIMKMLIGTLAVALAFASPVVAEGSDTQGQASKAQGKAVAAKTTKRTVAGQAAEPWSSGQPPYSVYVHHPSYDVYVNGEYAGSDPDPRIRWSLRREYCEQRVDGC